MAFIIFSFCSSFSPFFILFSRFPFPFCFVRVDVSRNKSDPKWDIICGAFRWMGWLMAYELVAGVASLIHVGMNKASPNAASSYFIFLSEIRSRKIPSPDPIQSETFRNGNGFELARVSVFRVHCHENS